MTIFQDIRKQCSYNDIITFSYFLIYEIDQCGFWTAHIVLLNSVIGY